VCPGQYYGNFTCRHACAPAGAVVCYLVGVRQFGGAQSHLDLVFLVLVVVMFAIRE
jgi:hypothetical protein